MANSTGPYGVQTSTCNCIQHFYFSTDNKCKIKCNEIQYAVNQDPNTNYKCICRFPFYFVTTEVVCSINCSLVAYSINSSVATPSNNQCACQTNFYFDSTNFICLINCSSIPKAIHNESLDQHTCSCQKYY